jgi:outer membrane protein OmpA-like peptidoglycan-associated protein
MKKAAWKGFLTICLLHIFFLTAAPEAGAEAEADDVKFRAQTNEPYTMVERSNFSRYDNGTYTGHVYREVRAAISPSGVDGADGGGLRRYKGNFIVMEETLRDMRQSARAVNAVVPVNFTLSPDGGIRIDNDRGFPALRNFPVYKETGVTAGATWKAEGQRAVDPLNDGKILITPFTAVYEYKGVEEYNGIPVHRIEANYKLDADLSALNSPSGGAYDTNAGAERIKMTGKHDITILLTVENSAMLLSRDILDETFSWTDGKNVRFKGSTLCFTQSIVPLDGKKVKEKIADTSGLEIEPVEAGLRLSIRDIQFVSDSAELQPSESERLDRIAASLLEIDGRTFLVEGHTAATGRAEAEMKLSIERAKRIVDELAARGVPLGRFIYKGWGGTKPAAGNDSEAGRRQNRRVEITILD